MNGEFALMLECMDIDDTEHIVDTSKMIGSEEKQSGQRVFDVDSKEDMDLLWSILPSDVIRIKHKELQDLLYYSDEESDYHSSVFKINFRDKTEITRPVDMGKYIGKLGWFSDYTDGSYIHFEKLKDIKDSSQGKIYLGENMNKYTKYFRPLTKEEWESMKPVG